MIPVYFIYGLCFFSLGLTAWLEARRGSELHLGSQLPWLAAFAITHSLVEWVDMFLFLPAYDPATLALQYAHTLLLPVSALLLIRFGIGLVNEGGPLPQWLTLAPLVLLVPVSFLAAYAVTVTFSFPSIHWAAEVWSRYLLFLPGCLLASFGFMRQWRGLMRAGLAQARNLMLGAALAFLFYAIVAGLVVPESPFGASFLLNNANVLEFTGLPVQLWRALAALALLFFVVRAFGVFEEERARRIVELRAEREGTQAEALAIQAQARESAEEWTNALVDISRRISNMESVDGVLAGITEHAQRLLNSDVASLALWDSSGQKLNHKCYATREGAGAATAQPVTTPFLLELLRRGRSARYPETADAALDLWECHILGQKLQSAVVVPLVLENQPVGGIWVGRLSPEYFSPADVVGLERLADQAVIAIEHAVMTSRLQSLAVIEERSRIAREMHDGLLQVLGYLSLETQTLESLVRQGNLVAVQAELKNARESIKAAQADVRENVLSLRTTLAGEAGLIPSLRSYVEEFGLQAGIDVEFVDGVGVAPHFSPLAETQLVRIVQEALANVRKHSHARRVQVSLSPFDHSIRVMVKDDGIGFAAGDRTKNHFGLQTMHER
ncbi:MAG TPA: GAF domain-containing sensor histidine kinase, partial [Anaerolineae bacterium]